MNEDYITLYDAQGNEHIVARSMIIEVYDVDRPEKSGFVVLVNGFVIVLPESEKKKLRAILVEPS